MNRACVTTQSGFRGFDAFFENGKDCFVAKSDEDFVEVLSRLLTDENLNKTMAKNACEKVKKYFSFDTFAEIVEKSLEKLTKR